MRDLPQRHREHREERGGNKGRRGTHTRVFAYEWQGKDLRDREFVRVAGKGLTGGRFCAFGAGSRGLKLEVRCWRERGWSQDRDKFRCAAHRDAEPRLDGGRIGRRVRVGAGGRWPLAKGARGKRAASRDWS